MVAFAARWLPLSRSAAHLLAEACGTLGAVARVLTRSEPAWSTAKNPSAYVAGIAKNEGRRLADPNWFATYDRDATEQQKAESAWKRRAEIVRVELETHTTTQAIRVAAATWRLDPADGAAIADVLSAEADRRDIAAQRAERWRAAVATAATWQDMQLFREAGPDVPRDFGVRWFDADEVVVTSPLFDDASVADQTAHAISKRLSRNGLAVRVIAETLLGVRIASAHRAAKTQLAEAEAAAAYWTQRAADHERIVAPPSTPPTTRDEARAAARRALPRLAAERGPDGQPTTGAKRAAAMLAKLEKMQ